MKRSAFADLVGVSKQMVSKYAASGLVVEVGGDVDAAATLAGLEGRLDEDKRQAALRALGAIGAAPTSAASTAPKSSAKAEKDNWDARLRELQYRREAGQLVDVEEVDAGARQAVAAMREAFGNRRRDIAEAICVQFGLPADKASPVARFIAREFEMTLGVFAREMAALGSSAAAAEPAPEPAYAAG